MGKFGVDVDAAEMGKRGGSKTSEKKAIAARLNPRRWCDNNCPIWDACPYRRNLIVGKKKAIQFIENNGYEIPNEVLRSNKQFIIWLKSTLPKAKRDEMADKADVDPYSLRPACALKKADEELVRRVRNIYERGLQGLYDEAKILLDKLLQNLSEASTQREIKEAMEAIALFKRTFFGDLKTLDINVAGVGEGIKILFEDAEGNKSNGQQE